MSTSQNRLPSQATASHPIPGRRVLSKQLKAVIDDSADWVIYHNLIWLAGRSMTPEQIYGACYLAIELAKFPNFQRRQKPTLKSVTWELFSCLFEHSDVAGTVWASKDKMLAAVLTKLEDVMTTMQQGVCQMILYCGEGEGSQCAAASKSKVSETTLEIYYKKDTNETLACRVFGQHQNATLNLCRDFDRLHAMLAALEQFGNRSFRKIILTGQDDSPRVMCKGLE